jgi:hypothetical protein
MKLDNFKSAYESLRTLIVWLGMIELGWISYWLLRSDDKSSIYTITVAVWIAVMLAWMALVINAGRRGFFLEHTRWLSNLVGVVAVVAFGALAFGTTEEVREGLILSATETTHRELASIHILRLLAIGTIIKYLQRQLPLHFVIWGAVPDFLFALSAVVVTIVADTDLLGPQFLLAWHSIGFFAFFGAGISMFFSVPSPLRISHGDPDSSIVFQFPMVLAPNFTVPLLMLAHAFAIVNLTAGG